MIEEWRQITEAPDCEVSNYGNVRVKARTITTVTGAVRYYNPRIISQNRKKSGYIEVALPIEKGKRIYRLVHRLVLETFNPVEGMELLEVNHIDEDKTNNNLDNLQWVSSKQNCNYGTRNKNISMNCVRYEIYCPELNKKFYSQKEAAQYMGISTGAMSEYVNGKSKPRNGYHWIRVGGYGYEK